MRHARHEIASSAFELVRHRVEHRASFLDTSCGPPTLGASHGFEGRVDLADVIDQGCPRLYVRCRQCLAQPLPVHRQGRVGVGRVLEAGVGRDGCGRRCPVLTAVGRRAGGPAIANSPAKPLGFRLGGCGPRLHGEEVVDEVLVRRVLFEPAEQVADRHVELSGGDGWRVEQHPEGVGLQQAGMGWGHALQHLELDSVGHCPLFGEQLREGDIEQVVTGDTDLHCTQPLGVEEPVEAALVVGVCLGLGCVWRLLPAVHRGVDLFHGQVRPLD